MAQRHSITAHPAFTPLVAGWCAALFGLIVAVLPLAFVSRLLAGAGLSQTLPSPTAGHWLASALAALAGGTAGLVGARIVARRGRPDPRPVFREPDPAQDQPAQTSPVPAPRPLRVREDFAEGLAPAGDAGVPQGPPRAPFDNDDDFDDDHVDAAADIDAEGDADGAERSPAPAAGEFMILTPQPIHPLRTDVDLDTLLEQFDLAIGAYGLDAPEAPQPAAREADPVRSFLARQTGVPAPSPLGGLVPDHQAELRLALDKLAEAMRRK